MRGGRGSLFLPCRLALVACVWCGRKGGNNNNNNNNNNNMIEKRQAAKKSTVLSPIIRFSAKTGRSLVWDGAWSQKPVLSIHPLNTVARGWF